MTRFARPDATLSAGGWIVAVGGGALSDQIDEVVPDDATSYIAGASPGTTCEIGLSNVTDPGQSRGHILRVRARETAADASLKFGLFENEFQRAISSEIALTADWTTYSITLSAAEADSITNYNNLRVKLIANSTFGDREAHVTWVEFEIPFKSRWGAVFI